MNYIPPELTFLGKLRKVIGTISNKVHPYQEGIGPPPGGVAYDLDE